MQAPSLVPGDKQERRFVFLGQQFPCPPPPLPHEEALFSAASKFSSGLKESMLGAEVS